MSVSLEIIPLSESLDMLGSPDRHSAYSLDGTAVIRIASPFTLFGRHQTTRILLQSLKLVFEGSTASAATSGFSSLRLCSVERELINGEPVEMNNEGLEDSNAPCCWNVLYNLPIPGWLPASSLIGESSALGTRYALYATAKFLLLDDQRPSFWTFCVPSSSRIKTIRTQKPITIRRLVPRCVPPATKTFLLDASQSTQESPEHTIPADVISKLRILASFPRQVEVASPQMDFILRFRAQDMDNETASRLHVTDLRFTLNQVERLRGSPSRTYCRRYPVPEESLQPPSIPLRDLNSFVDLVSMDFLDAALDGHVDETRTYSLLPSSQCGRYNLGSRNCIFSNTSEDSNTWYSMEFSMPFEKRDLFESKSSLWARQSRLRPSSEGPLYDVHHVLTVQVDCSYDLDDGTQAEESLKFSTKVNFAEFASLANPSSISLTAAQVVPGNIPSLAPSSPYASSLPVYSQLYESNGDRKVDYSIPLPLYTPLDSSSSSAPSRRAEAKISSEPTVSDEESAPLLS